MVGGANPVESLSRLQQNSLEDLRTMLKGYPRDWLVVLEKMRGSSAQRSLFVRQ